MPEAPVLIVLRGNSGSGKSSVARALRERFGYGLAWVEQDHLRRILLREHDVPHGKNIGLIELNVRYALEAGYVTVLEGILCAAHYAPMLERLYADYGGHWYLFDLPFEETVKRHATRPQARQFTPEQMRAWYQERDRLPFVRERLIAPDSTLEDTVKRIMHEANLSTAGGRLPIVASVNLSYSGQEKVQAPPAAVWAFLSDPAQVARCLPRIEDVQVIDATHLQGHVSMGSGFMKSKIKLNIEVVPDQAQGRVSVKVSGGGLGSALHLTAGANVIDGGDGTTTLDWQGQADMSGPLAKMAGKMAEEQGQKMIARTFQNLGASISQSARQA